MDCGELHFSVAEPVLGKCQRSISFSPDCGWPFGLWSKKGVIVRQASKLNVFADLPASSAIFPSLRACLSRTLEQRNRLDVLSSR